MESIKNLIWMGDALKNLKTFPEAIKDQIGYALHKVQVGETPRSVKTLKGFNPKVMEIIADHNTNTYRAVYTVKLGDTVYILHCFQKKSKHGISTPKQEIDLIKQRLHEAALLAQE